MPRLPSLAPLPPAPGGGAVTIVVPCSTSPDFSSATTHEVTIGPTWSLTTPHDLEAERVAVAFGGYSSCVSLERQFSCMRGAWLPG